METKSNQLTAETITIDQISALESEAAAAGDMRQAALCTEASQLLRDRDRGMVEWPAAKAPRALRSCVGTINAARAMAEE